jgi:SAM-dependent methyltransferase
MDAAMRDYYEQRAPEYDDWWHGTGLFERRERPGWHEDVAALQAALGALAPARTLDVACGTGFLTRHLPGELTALDQSATMLEVAGARVPHATLVQGDALDPPFEPGSFERVHAGHFYGHLAPEQRAAFLQAAAALAGELVITDSALRPGGKAESWEERALKDGSVHRVYKRWFTAEGLATELGGGETIHDGPWFVVVRLSAPRPPRPSPR